MAKRCVCCDLPVETCGKAAEARIREQERRERAALERLGWFEARYPGRCAGCGEHFPAGDLVAKGVDAVDGGWVAQCCSPVALCMKAASP